MTNTPIFDWSRYESFSQALFGRDVESEKILKKPHAVSYLFTIPQKIGDGFAEILMFGKSLTVVIFNCSWHESKSFMVNDGDRVRLNFSLELDMTMDFGEKDKIDLTTPSWRVINNPAGNLVHETVPSGARAVWVTLAFNLDYLARLLQDPTLLANPKVQELLCKSNEQTVHKEFPLDHRLNLITSNLVSMNLEDSLHLSYAEAKSSELACVALDRILQQQPLSSLPIKLRRRDEEAIKLAQEIIIKNLAEPPSLREICLMIGMNRNKLHYGFKHIFKVSLSQFVKEERLGRAYALLVETDKPVIEVALEVGFRHQSSFSTAFRRKYGFPPIQLRKTPSNH